MNTPLRLIMSTLCCTLALASPLSTADTLGNIYRQAVQNDYQFQAARAQLRADSEAGNLGRSALLPQIGAQAQWVRSEIEEGGLDQTYSRETTRYSVSLNQPLVDLSAWQNYRRGQVLTDLASAQFITAEHGLILRTANAYFEALQAVDNVNTAKAEEAALKQQLEQSQQRYEVGLTAITEVHEARAAYDSAVANRLVADGNLGIAFEGLEVLTGQPHHTLSPLKGDFPVVPPEPRDREAWVQLARENNADILVAKLNMEAAKASANARRNEHLPTLYGNLSYGNELVSGGRPPQAGQLPRDFDSTTATVGVTLNVPIFTGGATSASRREAYERYLAARDLHMQAQRDAVQTTRSAHLSVLTSVAAVNARQLAITSNQSALDATQAGYEVGTRDLVDVLNAQGNLFRAQRDYYDALYTYVLANFQLKQAAGVLMDDDVFNLSQWLDQSSPVTYQRD